ncbi:sulfotransferase 1C2A-like [Watersipora subatra]|uniref:sulfotransferase 1C2A-like n=1 Tax=Watersipora subatra TaxID=2589382 RepID=UPI00355AE884
MEVPPHPRGGTVTNCYMVSEDESVKISALVVKEEGFKAVVNAVKTYEWKDEDFLLASYPKNGTNFLWEIMTMLLRGTSDYIQDFKALCMMDLFPVTKLDTDNLFPSPRVLNTHYRLEALPAAFHGKKTVLVMRNPKDVCVSYFHQESKLKFEKAGEEGNVVQMTFPEYMRIFLYGQDMPFGNFFKYCEYMWTLKDKPNVHFVFYEELIKDPIGAITKVNEFMGTERSPELIAQIADATTFSKMQQGKSQQGHDNTALLNVLRVDATAMKKTLSLMFRKGKVGDWKDQFTVADNELFDAFLEQWTGGKDIPFIYV